MVDNMGNVSISVDNNNNSSLSVTRYKIVFIGDVSVGKTSILNRFLENKFCDVYQVYILNEISLLLVLIFPQKIFFIKEKA